MIYKSIMIQWLKWHEATHLDAKVLVVVEKVAQRLPLLGAALHARTTTQVQHGGCHVAVQLVATMLDVRLVFLLAVCCAVRRNPCQDYQSKTWPLLDMPVGRPVLLVHSP